MEIEKMEGEEVFEHTLTSDEKLKAWGYGEWVEEPEECTFEYKGFKCKVQRSFIREYGMIVLGHLCGYLHIPHGHPWHGKHCDDIDCSVHGSLTDCRAFDCDWVIGFDCAHFFDIIPHMSRFNNESLYGLPEWIQKMYDEGAAVKPSYKNMAYVISELKSLVDQAKSAKHKGDK